MNGIWWVGAQIVAKEHIFHWGLRWTACNQKRRTYSAFLPNMFSTFWVANNAINIFSNIMMQVPTESHASDCKFESLPIWFHLLVVEICMFLCRNDIVLQYFGVYFCLMNFCIKYVRREWYLDHIMPSKCDAVKVLISLLRLWTHNRPFFNFPCNLSTTLRRVTWFRHLGQHAPYFDIPRSCDMCQDLPCVLSHYWRTARGTRISHDVTHCHI